MFLWKLYLIVSLTTFLHDLHVSSCDCADEPVFTPTRLVVKYGDPLSASCSVCPNCNYSVYDVEKPVGETSNNGSTILWRVENMTEWDAKPMCYYTNDSGHQAVTYLPITLYKLPDNVSFSFNHTGPMYEYGAYTLQCEVQNVAPIGSLTVTFYRGQTPLIRLQSSKTGVKPLSDPFYHNITSTKDDDGVQFWCEAKLELGPEGPQPSPMVASNETTASVHYKPVVPSDVITVTIAEGERLELNCSTAGNPQPSYSWKTPFISPHREDSVFVIESVTTDEGGEYTCTVRNSVGQGIVRYNVDVKASNIIYIIIAVAVALTVIIIFIIGLYRCYKRSRKGQYNLTLKEARLEKMAEFVQKGEDLENNSAECKRLLEEAQGRLRELEEAKKEGEEDEERDAELEKVQAEVRKLKKDEKAFEKMLEQYRREEKKLPWSVDTISKEGFSKSVLNIKPVTKEETEEEKVEKHKTFVQKYAKEIKHFGMLRRWDDSQKYLSDNPHLVCEETANCLVVICIDFEIDEKRALMEQVAHQAIVMQFILDLARTLEVDPRGCFRQFFSKIKTADKPYQDAFDRELESLKERVRSCAQTRMEDAMKEEIQRSFDEKNIQMLQEAFNKLHPEVPPSICCCATVDNGAISSLFGDRQPMNYSMSLCSE
ncbi:hypothetical protein INR49_016166, partial [Caranx melampygus]